MPGPCSRVDKNKFLAAQDKAEIEIIRNVRNHKQVTLGDLPSFELPPSSTRQDFLRLCKSRVARFTIIAPIIFPGRPLDNGTAVNVPVTPPHHQDMIADHTFHTINMSQDAATVQILVREADNYVIAFRCYHSTDPKDSTPCWCIFPNDILPEYFGEKTKIQYSSSYGAIEEIAFGQGVLPALFVFLLSFKDNPHQATTGQGKNFIGLLFVLFGEAQRFNIALGWVLRNFDNPVWQYPSTEMCLVFHNWSALSKCYFKLYEAYQGMQSNAQDCVKRMQLVKEDWAKLEKQLCPPLKFRDGAGNITSECLLGSEIQLLKFDKDLCTRIYATRFKYPAMGKKRLDHG